MQGIADQLKAIDGRLAEYSWYRVTRNSILGFSRQEGPRKAAAMTYFAVFSIFPFLLLLMAILSFFISSEAAEQRVLDLFSGFLPAGPTGTRQIIQGVVAARGVAAGVGAVLLLWGAIGWFDNIDLSVNEMWGVRRNRSFVKGLLFDVGMVSGLALVMLVTWGANFAVGVLYAYAEQGTISVPGSAVLWDSLVWLVSLGLMFLVFLPLYRFSPMCDLTWMDVWKGALVTALIWSVVRSAFAVYVTYFANYASAYGSLGAVIAFITWLYVANMVVLFGAALTYAMRLDAEGIREPRLLPCGLPEEGAGQKRRRKRRKRAV